jgi:acyl carrier protein phosphodiesterase
MICDFVKGSQQYQYSPGIQNGIRLHREIDQFTDKHLATKEAKKIFQPATGKYAAPLIDIVYDHFLCIDEKETPQLGWDWFSLGVYEHLTAQKSVLPASFCSILPHMIQYNWLANYHHTANIEKSFHSIAKRSRYFSNPAEAFDLFVRKYDDLQTSYSVFFPEVKNYAFELLNSFVKV